MCDRWTRTHVWLKSKFWKAILKLIFHLYIQIKIWRPRYEFYVKTYSSKLVFLEPQISIQTWFWIFDLSQKWFRGIGNLSSLVENIWSSVTIRVKRSCKFRGAMCVKLTLCKLLSTLSREVWKSVDLSDWIFLYLNVIYFHMTCMRLSCFIVTDRKQTISRTWPMLLLLLLLLPWPSRRW